MVSLKTNREYTAMTNQIIISNTSIHQDTEGRYSLNDLHKAAGCEQRHQPRYWLALDQTNELIEEILNSGISLFSSSPTNVKKGRYGGTYVCKELVYSYAMWISAAFALKVIRAYDDLVSGKTKRTTAKSLPGKITADQQEAIKQLVMSRGNAIQKEKQAKAMITMWSALKTHFGCSYKEISEEQFTEALSLAARIPIEGEFIGKQDELPATRGDYNFPAETADPHDRQVGNAWMTPRVILDENNRAPELELLDALQHDGYDITGAKIRIHAMYGIVKQFIEMQNELSIAKRHLSAVTDIVKNQTVQRGSNVSFTGIDRGIAYGGHQKRSLA